jgi:hypothetical protein
MRRSATLRSPRRTGLAGLVAALLVVAVLAGCGGDDSKAVSTRDDQRTTTSAGPATTAATAGSATCTLTDGATTARSTPATDPTALLTDVQAAVHEGCDRVVFTFRDGSTPGYDVSYKSGPFNKGESNEPLEVQGAAFLVVRFDKASGIDQTTPMGSPTYTGSRTMTDLGLNHAAELVNAEDFEGVMTWVVGLDAQRPFEVSTLTSPSRVVVDIS